MKGEGRKNERQKRTIQVVRRHQQFQAQFGRHVDVRHVFGVLVLFVVVEVLAYLLEYEAAIGWQWSVAGRKTTSTVGREEATDRLT